MAFNECIFCGASPVTKEHLFPKWILRILKQEFSWEGGRGGRRTKPGGTQEWPRDRPLEIVVKCVCGKCNNGWMNDIEEATRPMLDKMIRGQAVELDTDAQEAVGTWVCLKAIIAAYAERIHPISQDWLDFIHQSHRPPDGWSVFTTLYAGKIGQMVDAHRVTLGIPGTNLRFTTTDVNQGVLTSFIIGHLAVQGRGFVTPKRFNERINVQRIWPASPLILLWPPRVRITDGKGLDSFRRMGFAPDAAALWELPPREAEMPTS